MPHEIQVSYVEPTPPQGAEKVFAKDRLKIGRCRDNDIAIEGTKLSRYHAEIFVAEGRLRVKDLGSRNGTWVNGARVSGERVFEPADVIMIGEGGPKIRAALVGDPPARQNPGVETTFLDKMPTIAPEHAVKPVQPEEPEKKSIGPQTLALAIDTLKAEQRTKTQKIVALAVGGLTAVVLIFAIVVVLLVNRTSSDDASRDTALRRLEDKIETAESRAADLENQIRERDEALDKIQKQQGLSDAERQALLSRTADQLASLRSELKAIGAGPQVWADLVERYKESVFLCVRRSKDGAVFGTAFAVSADGVLATNAHVALSMKPDAETFVIQNGSGRVFALKDRASNPRFDGPSSPDVALLRIDTEGTRLVPLPLASDEELTKLRTGTQLGTLGFPGELSQTYFQSFDAKAKRFKSAVATFKDGWISQITNYQGEVADFQRSTRIQHSASLTGGTSGSPMFTADGKVVALNNSSLDIVMPRGNQKIQTKSAAQIGYAIRVDELRRFMAEKGW